MASAAMVSSVPPAVLIRLTGGAELLLVDEERRAYLDGRSLDLTAREYALLRHLVRRTGQVCDRFDLRRHGFGDRSGGASRKVDIHVQRVRTKLGPYASHLETIRGDGYRFTLAPAGHADLVDLP
jgi:DNA-binding response OmpR family regulator